MKIQDKSKWIKDSNGNRGFLSFIFYPLSLKREAGFTLIEAVVAIALIAGGIVSALGLTTKSVFNASRLKNDLIAVNLAQEGIEMMRLIRENNVLCDFLNGPVVDYPWDDEPGGPQLPASPKLNSPVNGYTVDTEDMSVTIDCTDPAVGTLRNLTMPRLGGSCASAQLNLNSSGIYTYSLGIPTPFRRCVYVCNPPTSGPNCSGSADGDIPIGDQMDIISVVRWTDGGVNKEMRLEQRLYNWR